MKTDINVPAIFAPYWEQFVKANPHDVQQCDMGSCQYRSINLYYDFFLNCLRKDRYVFEKWLSAEHTYFRSLEEFLVYLTHSLINEIYTIFEDDEDDERGIIQPMLIEYLPLRSVASYYAALRKEHQDLWTAAISPFDGPSSFNDSIFAEVTENEENRKIAFWLAYTSYLYDVDVEAFSEFDT